LNLLAAWFFGLLFAMGLGVAGMTQPSRVIAFLDVGGNWNPSLMLVMGGALAVGFLLFPLILRRTRPVLEERFFLPELRRIDGRLLAGSTLFGVGWGLSGFCPGPALVSLVTLSAPVLVFSLTMLLGLGLGHWLLRRD
jgi:uncharacterized protein